jgi:hypothetical protein
MKFYDTEFAPKALAMLKQQHILGTANVAHYAILHYNLGIQARDFEDVFQQARRENPLLETTPPEVWIAAQVVPIIRDVRSNVEVDDDVLSDAVQKYLRHHYKPAPVEDFEAQGEQKLYRTIEHFIPAIERLLRDLFDRAKSLGGILSLARDRFKVGHAIGARQLGTRREELIIQAINENWRNQKLADQLDRAGIKPKGKHWKSYKQMLHHNSQLFSATKNSVKKKYLVTPPEDDTPPEPSAPT